MHIAFSLLPGWLRETTLSYDAAFYTAGTTVAFAAALLFIVKLLHKAERQDYLTRMRNDEIEEANSVASDEPASLLSEDMYIIEKYGKSALIDLIQNEVKNQKVSEQRQKVKVTDLNSFFFQVDGVHWQKYFDISKETSL